MSEDRILAVDLMHKINEAIETAKVGGDLVTYGEILFALQVCAAVVVSYIPEDRRQDYINAHMLGSAEKLGVPLISTEVDTPDKSEMN